MTSPSLDAHPRVEQWISLATPGTVTVRSGKVELGQRITTAIAAVAAAELDVSPERVHVASVVTDESPDEGITSGSNSIEHSAAAVRLAAATARRHLLALAARALGVPASTLRTENGLVRDPSSNRSVSYWELLPDGRFDIDVDTQHTNAPAALDPAGFEALRARRARALVTGEEKFLHDRTLPGMLHARVIHPPHANARLTHLDTATLCLPDTVQLIRDTGFLAVAGADEHAVERASDRVAGAAHWDMGDGIDPRDVFEGLRSNRRESLAVVNGEPVDGALPPPLAPPADALASLSACYERPYQMHGAIGPSAAMARLDGDTLTVWSHTQGVYPLRASLAEALGMAPDTVRVEHVPGPGCYGHNGADDAALEAALVARALPGRPVLLKWSREDEHAFEPYAPAMAVAMSGSIDGAGRVATWSHESFSDTHLARPRPGPDRAGPARLLATRWLADPPPTFVPEPARGVHTGIHRNADPLYRFAQTRVIKHLVRDLPHRTSTMRTLGGFANVFAAECFLDELARDADIDAVQLRLSHLEDPRARAVIERAAAAIGWHDAAPASSHGRGIAFSQYKNRQAYVAVAVTVQVDDTATVRLRRAVIAADAGRVVDADGLAAQLEGGFLQAASWTLCEAVTWDAQGITSRDWDSYPILRFDNVPEIAVEIVEREDQPPIGAGEAACGPAGAAIANAVCDATGLRLRRLPLTPQAIRRAAMA